MILRYDGCVVICQAMKTGLPFYFNDPSIEGEISAFQTLRLLCRHFVIVLYGFMGVYLY